MSTHGVASGTVSLESVAPLPPILLATPRGVLRMRSDAALAERFRAGYEDAFGTLYERHRAGVLAVCIGVLGSRHDAEDAAQDAFAALALALRTSPPRDLRAWLARVARNASIDLIRRRRITTEADETIEGPVRGGPEVRAELESVFMGLRQLPEAQRTALLMRELAGHSYQEIGDLLELDESAVRGLIARARIGLRAHREATEMPCAAAREALATEPDGRRRDRTVRRHVRGCASCKSYGHGLRKDARTLRSILPVHAGGLAGGGAIFGGFAAKTVLTGGVLTQVTAACAVSVCAVGGIALFYPHSPVHHHVQYSAPTAAARSGALGQAAVGISLVPAARALGQAPAGAGAARRPSPAVSRAPGAVGTPGYAPASIGQVVSSPTVALHRRFHIPGSQNAAVNPVAATGANPTAGAPSAAPTPPPAHPVLATGTAPGTWPGWSYHAGSYAWGGSGWGWSGADTDGTGTSGTGSTAGTGTGTGSGTATGGSSGSTGTGSTGAGGSGAVSTGAVGTGAVSTGAGTSSTGAGTGYTGGSGSYGWAGGAPSGWAAWANGH